MQKKDDKVGNKTANKQERQRKKREGERKIEIDLQIKKVQILAFVHEEEELVKNAPFLLLTPSPKG